MKDLDLNFENIGISDKMSFDLIITGFCVTSVDQKVKIKKNLFFAFRINWDSIIVNLSSLYCICLLFKSSKILNLNSNDDLNVVL